MYATRPASAEAKPGQPAPNGTVLIMEDRKARVDAQGQTLRDADGRMMPSDEITNIFVMRKEAGWGEAHPPEKRNGDWEYAWFNPDGSRRANATMDGCFACHQNRAGRDFTFTFFKWVLDGKK